MLTAQNKTIYRGQTAKFVLTVTDEDGERFDLTGHTLYMRWKLAVTDAEPGLIELETGSGIVHRTQTSPDVGVADVTVTSAQTSLLTASTAVFDVWLEKSSGEKHPVVPVSEATVLTPVTVL